MANAVVKLQATLTELSRQVTASVDALHTIRARTSKVLLATAAFGALAVEVDVLRSAPCGRRLASTAVAAELLRDDDDRATFHAELHRLIDQLESYRLVYAAELSLAAARRGPPRPAAGPLVAMGAGLHAAQTRALTPRVAVSRAPT